MDYKIVKKDLIEPERSDRLYWFVRIYLFFSFIFFIAARNVLVVGTLESLPDSSLYILQENPTIPCG
mgnify:CR=1 FL=1